MINLRKPDRARLRQKHSDEESISLQEYIKPRLPEPLDSAHDSQSSRPAGNTEPRHPASTRQNTPLIPQPLIPSSTKISDSVDSLPAIADSRQVNHEACTNKLREVLKPILTDNPSVLLCWGENSCCHILPVNVTNSTNEEEIWHQLRGAWYARKGSWKKYLPFFNVREVDIVEVSIAGQESILNQKSTYKDGFIGTYTTDNLLSEKKQLEQIIADYQPQEFPCPYDPSIGCVNCLQGCISQDYHDEECPEKRLCNAERELSSFNMGPFLKMAFFDPGITAFNSLLGRGEVVFGHLDILRELNTWNCPDLRELRFRGVLIREGWSYSQHYFWLLALVLYLMVVVSRLVYGDWSTAWNVGCFLVSLIGLAAGDTFLRRRIS